MNVILRPAGVEEANRLMDFIQAYYEFDGIPFDAEKIKPPLEELLSDKSLGRAWFIEAEGAPTGFVIATFGFDLEFGGRLATVTELYLHPEYRRKGLGARALELLQDILAKSGMKTLELEVEITNTNAFAFYKKIGFQVHDRIPLSRPIGRTHGLPAAHSETET
jgi:ribosomal protein S18 acetylase RimI-like enzyme